jgi:hypothetical protein
MNSLFARFCPSPILCRAVVMLFALSVGTLGIFTSPFAQASDSTAITNDQPATTQSTEKAATTQVVAKISADETATNEGCMLSYTSLFGPYRESGADGNMVIPEQRVVFGGSTSAENILTFKTQGKKVECPLVYQDVAYHLDEKGQRGNRVAMLYYIGCPIALGDDLEPWKDIEMREEVRITITSSTDNVLWSDLHTAVPFYSNGQDIFPVITCANETLVFAKKGMTFHTAKNDYITEKAGALIQFTKDGIKFDGVTKQARSVATQPLPSPPATPKP